MVEWHVALAFADLPSLRCHFFSHLDRRGTSSTTSWHKRLGTRNRVSDIHLVAENKTHLVFRNHCYARSDWL